MADSGPWLQVTFEVPEALIDPVSSVLQDFGSTGQELREPDASGCVQVVAYFRPGTPPARLTGDLKAALGALVARGAGDAPAFSAGLRMETVAPADWAAAWRAHFRPIHVAGRICVCPPWERVPDPPGGFTVVIEPRMAFGTGHHETTRLALERMVTEVVPGQRVLDVGCGSGILSIAAAKLGASDVTAVDTDPDAVSNTRENAAINATAGRVHVAVGSAADADGNYDLVVANIISSALVPILPDIAGRMKAGGRALLGGLLTRETAWFRAQAMRAGLVLLESDTEGEWAGFVATTRVDGLSLHPKKA
jgi:ribosomal protein L11 methyltransferase